MALFRMSRIAQPRHFKIAALIILFALMWVAWEILMNVRTANFKRQPDSELSLRLINSQSAGYPESHNDYTLTVKLQPDSGLPKRVINSSANNPKSHFAQTISFKRTPGSAVSTQLIKSSAYHASNHNARTANFKLKPASGYSKQLLNTSEDIPGNHLNCLRFDVIFKLVYAYYYYSMDEFVPNIFKHAYLEHQRAWNQFKESCRTNTLSHWFDARLPCKDKNGANDFIESFHNTIDSIREHGFESKKSRIPTDKNGVILNGAHRLAAATILCKNATFEYFDTLTMNKWNYLFFEKLGVQRNISDLVMLEWMKLQLKLPQVASKVFILSVFIGNQNNDDDNSVRKIVSQKCSKDNGILYEKSISVTKLGMSQLVRHMYGNQHWLPGKIQVMLSMFKRSEFRILFMFFFGKSLNELKECKLEVRTLFNYRSFKSSAHIPDLPEESFILAQMILNPNSVQFLNHGQNGLDCLDIATELATRSSLEPVPSLPGFYIDRDDVMIDSGSVMHIFNLRNRTDVDILFLHDINKKVLGNKNGFNIEAHAFKTNAIDSGRPRDENHFSETVKSKWDLFYDPRNFGFCYGIKFVSLDQLIKYKLKRNNPQKDHHDIHLIRDFLSHKLSDEHYQRSHKLSLT